MPPECIDVIEGFLQNATQQLKKARISNYIKKGWVNLENSVYNKVYKTGLHDRPKLVIPLINEIFQEQYKGQEQIEFLESTHYLKDPDGKLVGRTNDSHYQVLDERKESFHVETQSGVSVHEVAVLKLG